MRKLIQTLLGIAAMAFSMQVLAVPITTDIVSIVDESSSMGGEHAWLPGMTSELDSALAAEAGTDAFSARYGLVGFGGIGSHLAGHQHDVGGVDSQFGTASAVGDAADEDLNLFGGTEDGYSGIDAATQYDFRSGAVSNLILVTDEDRDDYDGSLNYENTLSSISSLDALLNAVLDVDIECGDGTTALGVDATGTGYKADGAGGFTNCSGAAAVGGYGTTVDDYVNLALATGGAAWDLNQLREGGDTATSFTNAFVSIKVQETVDAGDPLVNVPEPGTLALLGLGLAGLKLARHRRTV